MGKLDELLEKQSLRSDEVVEGMVVVIEEEMGVQECTNKKGGKYNKYIIPVSLDAMGTEMRNIWFLPQEARKIVKACGGTATKDYVGAKLKLGLETAVNKETKEVMKTADGVVMQNIVIREVIVE